MQIAPSSHRLSAYGATLTVVLLASSAPAVTRLSLTHAFGPLGLVLLRCGVAGLVFLPFLLARWRQLPRKLAVVGLALAFLHGWGMHLTAIAGLQFAQATAQVGVYSGIVSGLLLAWPSPSALWTAPALRVPPLSRETAAFSPEGQP